MITLFIAAYCMSCASIPFLHPMISPPTFKSAESGLLKGYCHVGNGDREKAIFSEYTFLARWIISPDAMTGIEKPSMVMGTRMGRQQTVITAGLHPAVTAMMALVPSNCDAAGAHRWPRRTVPG
jgi:hypothetical protein